MEVEEAVVLLAAAPATAYREYLYRPGGRLARWIDDRFEVLATPGRRARHAVRAGDVLIEVRLGDTGPGRCVTLAADQARPDLFRTGLPPGRLLLRPRRPAQLSEPRPVEPEPAPAVPREHYFGDDEAGSDTPVTVDAAAAVPPFAASERSIVARPLLSARQAAEAVAWTRRTHPAVSGVGLDDLRAALRNYVDETAVAAAVGRDPDTVLVECVHQFQIKCYRDPREHDGRAGESALDSLGLVVRAGTGFRGADQSNARALRRLRELGTRVGTLTGNEFSPANWFDAMTDPSVFGWRTQGGRGLHLVLVRRLRQAERYLLALPAYRGKTPAALAAALGITETHKGARPTATTASVHTFGLAIDIAYLANPWINDSASWTALQHAAALISGTRLTQRTATGYFSELGESGRTTGEIWDILHGRSAELIAYLHLADRPAELHAALQARPDLVEAGESLDHAVERLQAQIRRDRERLVATDFGASRVPENGFLNLPRDLVIALRDHACLAWGAVDFGPAADGSGDMMHFDARIGGVGEALARTRGGNFVPSRGHPCLGARPAAPTEDDASAEQATDHLGGRLWSFVPAAYALPVAVFGPQAALAAPDVEVLFFAHGLLRGCPRPKHVPIGFVTDKPFALGDPVAASGRPMILVVPLLDWHRPGGEEAFGRGHERWHALAQPARFNELIDEVMAEVGRVRGTAAPGVASLVVAGHSRAYDFLEPLAASRRQHAGVLARLSEVWAFDTTYVGRVSAWVDWVAVNPALRVHVFYHPHSRTSDVGEDFGRHSRAGLVVTPVPEQHCDVPATRLRQLLAKPSGTAPAGLTESIEAESETVLVDAESGSGVVEAEAEAGDAGAKSGLSAEELVTRIVRCIGIVETHRGGNDPRPRESDLTTVAGVPASMASVEQATIPYAITVLRRHKALRDQAQPALTLNELNAANTRVASVEQLLNRVKAASATGTAPDAFIAASGPAIAAAGLGDDDVRRMFRAEVLQETLDVARAERDAAGRAAAAAGKAEKQREASQNQSVAASVAGIPDYDRLGVNTRSLTTYINQPSTWGENRAAWQRRAVRNMPGDVEARIRAVAVADRGRALALSTTRDRVAAELAKDPQPTTEQIVRAVAHRNNPGSAGYAQKVWETYHRLYP